jgi:hypothetical protein
MTDLLIHRRGRRQLTQNDGQFLLQPWVQHCIDRRSDTLSPHLAAVRAEQRQQFGRAIALILVRLPLGLAMFGPTLPRIGTRLIRSCLILGPHRQTPLRTFLIGTFNQFFLASASGSVTITVPLRRLRTARPLSHQLRAANQRKPVSCSTRPIV